ncbi:MAG: thiol:disulfide interchange protein, partial [Microcystaceae cyanobacterium]
HAMAKDLAVIKPKYKPSLNFVIPNMDNDKLLPEVLRYRVDGIPHFVYLDAACEAIANTIGEQPLNILEANLTALMAAAPLPYVQLTGQTSLFTPELNAQSQEDPRSHGTPTPSTR